jgi:hypothetical protein
MAVEAPKPASINDLAETLQALLGKTVLVVSSLDEPSFCMSLRARAMAIEASPDTSTMTLHFSASDALTVPIRGTICASGSSERHGHKAYWVELHLPSGPTVMIEELSPQNRS